MLNTQVSFGPGDFRVTADEVPLYTGLYAVVGPSGSGKSLATWALAQQVNARVQAFFVNESHGVPLDLPWFLNELRVGDGHGFWADVARMTKHEFTEQTLSSLRRYARVGVFHGEGRPTFTEPIVVIDSGTAFLWQAEQMEIVSHQDKTDIAHGKTSAKRGGVTGEVQQFLQACDAAAVATDRTVIMTINSEQYPLIFDATSSWRQLFGLFKGIVTGVIVPELVPGGDSCVLLSDRLNRDGRRVPLTKEAIQTGVSLLQLVPPVGAMPSAPRNGPDVWRR